MRKSEKYSALWCCLTEASGAQGSKSSRAMRTTQMHIIDKSVCVNKLVWTMKTLQDVHTHTYTHSQREVVVLLSLPYVE